MIEKEELEQCSFWPNINSSSVSLNKEAYQPIQDRLQELLVNMCTSMSYDNASPNCVDAGFSSKIGTTHQGWDRKVFVRVLDHWRKSLNLHTGYRGKGTKELLKQGPKKQKRKDSLSSPQSIRNPFVSLKRYIFMTPQIRLFFSFPCSFDHHQLALLISCILLYTTLKGQTTEHYLNLLT